MTQPRQIPLYDPTLEQGSWNERMAPGEIAVHFSSHAEKSGTPPFCTIFPSLQEAESYAHAFVKQHPTVRTTLYSHEGRVGAPLRDIRGADYKDTEITARFRRWVGSILFFGGGALTLLDWVNDFSLSWPAMVGTRMILPGLTLLFTEAMIMLHDRKLARRAAAGTS